MKFSTLLIELTSVLGSLASVVSLVVVMRPKNAPLTVLEAVGYTIAGFLVLLFGTSRVRDYVKLMPRTFKTKKKIRDYMYRWISRGERVAIFSRDMSWVDDGQMRDLLRRKARKHELILCLPRAINLSNELGELGAEIHVYPDLDFTPSSRFTIINVGRHDSQVAIGRRMGDVHTIQEAASGHDPLFAVAEDLVSVVSRLGRCR
jgi:hypothetical protein